ncbi:unnamed protein product [Meloidogyne enterolobii]|uniref:Uncharacterized protein n=1 Tax=Meloidogyne enterolobii TaxID=390850 RepID=A0ACB0YVG6_MELEN
MGCILFLFFNLFSPFFIPFELLFIEFCSLSLFFILFLFASLFWPFSSLFSLFSSPFLITSFFVSIGKSLLTGLTKHLFPICTLALFGGLPSSSIIFPKLQVFLGWPSCCTITTSPTFGSLFSEVRSLLWVHFDLSLKINKYSRVHLVQNFSKAF